MTWFWTAVAVYLMICYVCLAASYWICNDAADKEHWERLCELFHRTGRLRQAFVVLAMLSAFLLIGPLTPWT